MRQGVRNGACLTVLLLLFLLMLQGVAVATEWIPLTGVVHVHSSEFSSGAHTLDQLVTFARQRGVEVIVLTDHDRIAMSYGLPPFPHLFSLTRSRNSVLKQGARKYLERVNQVDAANPDVLLIPALESAPFYYWTGSLWSGQLTAHDWRKHIHVIGLDNPDDLEHLPILDNGFSTRYFFTLLPRFMVFAGILLLGMVLISWKGPLRSVGKIVLLVGILGALDAQPFRSSPYDPYHGSQGVAPYQELINYVRARGGMTFWAHPEANYGDRGKVFQKRIAGISLPKIRMHTGKHPLDLVQTYGYTGFEALYGDTIHATDPGKEWDRVLIQYCDGKREQPVWGLCGLDYHRQGQNSWSDFRRGQTIFWVKKKTRKEVLDAMRYGRMYSVYQGDDTRLRLDDFSMTTGKGGKRAISGETLEDNGLALKVRVSVTASGKQPVPVRAELIDSGKILKTVEGKTPFTLEHEYFPMRDKGYVRLEISSKKHRIISNPIFYKNTISEG